MKKKLLIMLLLAALALSVTACGNSKEEDPGAQKQAVTDLDNDMLESYLNQYNMDAENPIQSDDLTQEDGSASCKVTDLTVTFTTKDDDLQVAVQAKDLEDKNLDVVVRDLIIAMDPELTYEEVKDMFSSFREDGRTSYDMGEVKCKLKESKGTYTLTISNKDES